jgi:hypothetical protein
LKCSSPNHLCIQDRSSTLGGRCALNVTYNNSTLEISAEERELQTTCIKCQGSNACQNLTQSFIDNNIGCGSCIGTSACAGVSGEDLTVYILYIDFSPLYVIFPNVSVCRLKLISVQ